ncbi:pullulanase-associated domain-containing protein [Paenibacillus aurantiacus]|uniref:Pullulanase-associated domain-containing protein n=1 Tax=Paenibacillus aurantiacus TaxID=1936118 RepID=A0ABV5KPX5_9BACL
MKRNLWARGLRIALMLSVLSGWMGLIPAAANSEAETTLTVHYKQKEGDATEWSLWVWGEGQNGERYAFTGEDEFGKVAVIKLPGEYRKVGVIVSTEDWKKDGGDRFVDIAGGSGELRIIGEGYVEDSAGRDVPYLWMIVAIVLIPAILHAMEYARSRKSEGAAGGSATAG